MMDKKEIAKLIYKKLKGKEDISNVSSLLSKNLKDEKSDKLKLTKTPILNSIGYELGKLLAGETWELKRLKELWEISYSKKQDLSYRLLTGREIRLIVIGALGVFSKKEYEVTKNFIFEILDTIQDWEACDQLALRVVVNLAIQNQREVFSILKRWIHSDNKWIRRLAIATIPPYIRAKKEEAKTCLEILDEVMQERDKDVKKAIGWALREISKKDEQAVFDFLQKWASTYDKNTKQIVKDGMKKLSQERQEKLRSLINK